MNPYSNAEYAAAVELMTNANEQFPGNANILYILACFESLLGLAPEAITHLSQAIALDELFRALTKSEDGFDPVRAMPKFKALLSPYL